MKIFCKPENNYDVFRIFLKQPIAFPLRILQLEFQYLTTLNTKLHKLIEILYLLKLNVYCMYVLFNSNKLCLCPLGNIHVFFAYQNTQRLFLHMVCAIYEMFM